MTTYPKKSGRFVCWKSLQRCSCSNQSITRNNVVVNIPVSLLVAFNRWLKNRLKTSAKFGFFHLHCVLEADWSSCQHCLFPQQFNLATECCRFFFNCQFNSLHSKSVMGKSQSQLGFKLRFKPFWRFNLRWKDLIWNSAIRFKIWFEIFAMRF